MKNSTIDYYNKNAEQYANSTYNLDLNDKYAEFLKDIKLGGKILDVGCGSGRDIKSFQELGYIVDGLELSENLAKIAYKNTNALIKNISILNYNEKDKYDGIWCMASLLHLTKKELPIALSNIANALNENGKLFVSFKLGQDDGLDENGRFFSYYQINELQDIFNNIDKFSNFKILQDNNDKMNRKELSWISIYANKKSLILTNQFKNKF